jgi:membrane protease YdiL (CAAX protease family)
MFSLATRCRDPHSRPAVVILLGTFLYTLWHVFGRPAFYKHYLADSITLTGDPVMDAGIYWALANLLLCGLLVYLIRNCFDEPLASFGLSAGKVSFGISRLLLATPIVIGIGYLTAQQGAFQAYYPINKGVADSTSLFVMHVVVLSTYYMAWELLFRGFIQHGVKAELGIATAIAVQTLASTLAHADRPAAELIGSFFAGLGWGIMVHRGGAIWTVFLQHWILGIALSYFICFG